MSDVSDGSGKYAQFLEGIITEGLLRLLDSEVTVKARRRDTDIVRLAAQHARGAYKEISGRDVEIQVEGSLSDNGYANFSLPLVPLLDRYPAPVV